MGKKLEERGCKVGVQVKKEYEACRGCLELRDQITKDNHKIALLEDEVKILKKKNEDLEQRIQHGYNEEEEKIMELMIEINVLDCEKKKAENDVKDWKIKCEKLEMAVMELKNSLSIGTMKTGVCLLNSPKSNGIEGPAHGFNCIHKPGHGDTQTDSKANEDEDPSGDPRNSTPSTQYAVAPVAKRGRLSKSTARKALDFKDISQHTNISPATPGGRSSIGPIDLSDSDDDLRTVGLNLPDTKIEGRGKVEISTGVEVRGAAAGEKVPTARDALEPESDGEDSDKYNGRMLRRSVRKRRRSRKISSDSENEDDDDAPICTFIRDVEDESDTDRDSSPLDYSSSKKLARKRRLRLACSEVGGVSRQSSHENDGIDENPETHETEILDNDDDDEMEQDESESESSDEFIATSDDSDCDSTTGFDEISEGDGASSSNESSDDLGNQSDSNVDFRGILSGLRRERKDKTKWDLEGDMLADFGKHPELCMKAVCALYRQQTSDEKSCKATIDCNGRGFSQCHAYSGSRLAEFLIDGDPENDVNKSVEELQEFDPKGIQTCKKLAKHYSKQLFQIYKEVKDPFFCPLDESAGV